MTMALGDLIGVPLKDGGWGVLQVSAFRASASGSRIRSTFSAGVLPWRGEGAPTRDAISGLQFLEHGLTPIKIFTEGRLEVVDTAPLAGGVQSNLNDYSIGTTHSVWGWKTAIRRAQEASLARS